MDEYITFELIQEYVGITNRGLFVAYIKEVFKDLAERAGSDKKKGISKIIFYDYMKLPIFIADKLFSAFDLDNDGFINSAEFIEGMQDLYMGDFDSTIEIVFDLLDFDKDSIISKDDVKILLSYLPLKKDHTTIEYKFQMESLNEIDDILKVTFGADTVMKLPQFRKIVETRKSDVYLQILCFLYQKKPFNSQSIEPIKASKKRSKTFVSPMQKKSSPNLSTPTSPTPIKFLTPSRKSSLSPAEGFIKEVKLFSDPKKKKSFLDENTPQVSGIKGMIRLHNESIPEDLNDSDTTTVNEVLKRTKNIYNTPTAFLKPKVEFSKEIILTGKTTNCNNEEIDNPSSEESDEEDKNDNSKIEYFQPKEEKYENWIYKISEKGKLKKYYLVVIGKDIYYYKSDQKVELLGMHNLSGCFIKENGDQIIEGTKYYCFQIIFTGKKRNYYTTIKEIAMEYVLILKQAIGYTNFFDYYEMLDDIGEGKFGLVKLGMHKNTQERVAIKIIKKLSMNEADYVLVKSEIDIMKLCRHPNIVRLLDHFENAEYIFIVMEYLSGGDLELYFKKSKFKFSEEKAAEILYQITEGIQYLHQFGIAHRDLKPENIMLSDSSDKAIIKIMDFGLSKILGPREKVVDGFGTLSFVAPEVLVRKPYNKKIDIWSIGVILFYMLSGKLPFDDENDNEEIIAKMTVFNEVEFPDRQWKNRSKSSIDVIKGCLTKDPEKRIMLSELLNHEWFASFPNVMKGTENEIKTKKSMTKVKWADIKES